MGRFPKSALPQAAAPHHLSSDGVWTADNSCLHYSRVLHQCILYLCGSNPVPVEELPFREDWTQLLGKPQGLESVRIKIQITLLIQEMKLTHWS